MRMLFRWLVCGCGILFLMCGYFAPRDITTVPAVTESGDPFMFSALLDGTGETFPRYTWQDFFNEECRYVNVPLTSEPWSRDELINHLLQQHELFPDIKVDWKRTEEVVRAADRIILNNVKYSITDPHFADSVLFDGSSDFELVRDSSSVLKIIQWRDYADNPFFSPEM